MSTFFEGEEYTTVSGFAARIYATDGGVLGDIHGAVKHPVDGWQSFQWTSTGRCIGDATGENPCSLVPPIPQVSPDDGLDTNGMLKALAAKRGAAQQDSGRRSLFLLAFLQRYGRLNYNDRRNDPTVWSKRWS
jgi:hypothetical protein